MTVNTYRPFLTTDELYQIAKYLPLACLKECRLVSFYWNQVFTLPTFRNISIQYHPWTSKQQKVITSSLESILHFVRHLKLSSSSSDINNGMKSTHDSFKLKTMKTVEINQVHFVVKQFLLSCPRLLSIDLTDVACSYQLDVQKYAKVLRAAGLQWDNHHAYHFSGTILNYLLFGGSDMDTLNLMFSNSNAIIYHEPVKEYNDHQKQPKMLDTHPLLNNWQQTLQIRHLTLISRFQYTESMMPLLKRVGKCLETLRLSNFRLPLTLFHVVIATCRNLDVLFIEAICGFTMKKSVFRTVLQFFFGYAYIKLDSSTDADTCPRYLSVVRLNETCFRITYFEEELDDILHFFWTLGATVYGFSPNPLII